MAFMEKLRPQIYAVFRIVVGLMFAQHGAQKLFGLLGGFGEGGGTAPLFSLMGLAGVIEFFGGFMIALGLAAGWAAFICSGTDGCGLLHGPFPPGLFSHPEPRRAGRRLLLHLSLHREPRCGHLEHRLYLA